MQHHAECMEDDTLEQFQHSFVYSRSQFGISEFSCNICFNCWKKIKSDKFFPAVDLKFISVREFCFQLFIIFCCANRFENNFVRADFLPNDIWTLKIMSVISSSWTVESWLSFEKLL